MRLYGMIRQSDYLENKTFTLIKYSFAQKDCDNALSLNGDKGLITKIRRFYEEYKYNAQKAGVVEPVVDHVH